MKDLLVQLKFKNNIFSKSLEDRMDNLGVETIKDFCIKMESSGVFTSMNRRGDISSFGNLTKNPRLVGGGFNISAIEISQALNVDPDVLYPAGLYAFIIAGHRLPQIEFETESSKFVELDSPEVLALESGIDIEKESESFLKKEQIEECLEILKPRQQKIIKMRFGLDDGVPHTLEEVGKEFNLNRNR